MLQSARTDGSSGIIVRNNTFDGLTSWEAIGLYGVESIPEGQYFAISNNNFRIAAGATMDPGYNFIGLRHQTYDFKDTARVYIVNNIFEGNGSGYFAKFNDDFSIYSDYNLVYNFSNYIGDQGSLIGTSNDQTGDPLYIDDNLHIGAGSPAINNGASVSDFNFIPLKDYNGTLRPQGVAVDIGAYEKIE